MASILESSEVLVSPVYMLLDFALKSPMATIKKELVVKTASRVSSKLISERNKISTLLLEYNLVKVLIFGNCELEYYLDFSGKLKDFDPTFV